MADETVKKLLIDLKISTSEWKAAIADIRSQLNAVNEKAKADAAQMKTLLTDQVNVVKKQADAQKTVTAETTKGVGLDKQRTASLKEQTAILQEKLVKVKLETAEQQKQNSLHQGALRLEQERLRLAEQQYRLLQAQTKEHQKQRETATGGGGRGEAGGFGGALVGALGGGPLGLIAGGAAIGGVISEAAIKLIDSAKEKIHALGEALLEATGPTAQLREQFEKLTARAGESPDEYLEKLRASTRGLIEDVQLYRIANGFMQSGIKVTTEDMLRLTKATVDLARSQGKDATQAAQALERALRTGRTMQLAMVTGLTRQELQLKGVSAATDAVTRNTLQFNQVLAAEEARLRAIGTPATTLPELLTQFRNVQKNFTDDLALAISKSQGYKDAINELSKVLWQLEPVLARIVTALAKLTDSFIVIAPTIKLFIANFKAFFELGSSIEKIISTLFRFDDSITTIFSDGKASKFRQVMAQIALGILTMSETLNQASIRLRAFGDIASNVLDTNFKKARDAYHQMQTELDASKDEYLKSALGITKFGLGIESPAPKAGPQQSPSANIAAEKQLQSLRLQIAKETNKLQYDLLQERLKAEGEAVKRSYDESLITLEGKIAREREIEMQAHAARLAELKADRDAEVTSIQLTAKQSAEPRDITQAKITKANVGYQAKVVEQTTSHNQRIGNLDDQLTNDKTAAAKERATAETKIAAQGVQERLALVEQEFKTGKIDAEEYLTTKRDLINQEYLAEEEGLQKQLALATQNSKEREKLDAQRVELKQKTEKDLAVFDANQEQVRLQYMEKQYSTQRQIGEFQLRRAENVNVRGGGSEVTAQQNLITLTEQYISKLQQKLILEKEGSESWLKIAEQIDKADSDLTTMIQKLAQMRNVSSTIGEVAGGIGGILGGFRTPGLQGAGRAFENVSQTAPMIGRLTTNVGAGGGIGQYMSALGQSFKDLITRTGDASENLKNFGAHLGDLVSGIAGAVKGVTSGQTGGQGALSGAASFAQLGSMFGPWGTLIGGAAGGIMGGIFGNKEKQLQEEIHKIQAQLQSIVSDLQAGTISLTQAIQDLRNERQQAIQMLSQGSVGKKGGKGGGKKGLTPSQAQSVIQQIDQQIQQLVNEQSMLLQQLNSSLMELSQPIAFQQYVSQLDTIIQKYQQFASAAQGNAQEVAAANQYLNDSLQQYVTTLSQQLNQAQQQAIQDALTLINLEYQRQQIINQEAQQEYDILSQGVLTRQRTTAMTKGQEIGQLRYQRDMQLEQINEQISLQQYKVSTEQQIFGLATTRIGLESQLLEAQKEQANYQIQQVQALASVVSSLSTGLSSGQTMQQIQALMANGTMPTGPGVLYTLLQELGLAGNVPSTATQGQYGITNWLATIPAQYASAAQYVASLDPNFVSMIMAGQWANAASDAQQYSKQGTVEGYDMSGFISWLQDGGAGAAPQPGTPSTWGNPLPGGGNGWGPPIVGGHPVVGYAAGGDVPDTGMAYLHKGEVVVQSPLVKALNAMLSSVSGGGGSSTSPLQVHSALTSMTAQRTAMEMSVISARQTQIQQEASLLQLMSDHLDQISAFTSSTNGNSLEGQFQKIYELRGRYGSGNFRRETL